MAEAAIKVVGLGKRYRISHRHARYRTLRDSIADAASLSLRALGGLTRAHRASSVDEDFWALKDVSFEIKRGDIVGVIGRNGAGKSTLLKVLSRITEPTEGYAEIYGRVSSLLEVGTGFHPELTGRENVYLNGAILGMMRAEVDRKFDEIVAFAEVEKFIDTPVKHYSSGMYLRLAFGVAAHLEPEILILDEVLAVGDAQFQKKCLGKIEDVSSKGRTVLVVSHNMSTVTQLCKSAIWLSGGELKMMGSAEQIASKYLVEGAVQSGEAAPALETQDRRFHFRRICLRNDDGAITSAFDVRESITLEIEYEAHSLIAGLELSARVTNSFGIPIFTTNRSASVAGDIAPGAFLSRLQIPGRFLAPGSYTLELGAHIPNVEIICQIESVIAFRLEETGSGMAAYSGRGYGVVLLDVPWLERNA